VTLRFASFGFTYAGADRPALRDVSLDLPPGRVVSVLAPQGTGKTTLLRAAAGLLGEVYPGETRGDIARAEVELPGSFFDGYVQVTLAVETVREEIALPLHAVADQADRAARVASVVRELRIEHLLDREVTTLSGGEEKLVGIAAALVADRQLYVLDEPFEQLDITHLSAVIRAARLRARRGSLVLVATGSVDTALNMADVSVVFDGARWRSIDEPTYADIDAIPGLTESSLGRFLRGRSRSTAAVRRFRDGVKRAR
jgi:energy-coupling factor transporter ATP-binding protein EcfA2